jgi:hypothetical protein
MEFVEITTSPRCLDTCRYPPSSLHTHLDEKRENAGFLPVPSSHNLSVCLHVLPFTYFFTLGFGFGRPFRSYLRLTPSSDVH